MSAIEIIEEIKKLPGEEQRKVAAYLDEIKKRAPIIQPWQLILNSSASRMKYLRPTRNCFASSRNKERG